jgi:hypothetical protein
MGDFSTRYCVRFPIRPMVHPVGTLTSSDIFGLMTERLREAEGICTEMSKTSRPAANRRYLRLIEVCKEIEGCCRQAGHFRENHEWMQLAEDVHTLQIKMGVWIRAKHRGESQKRLFATAATAMGRIRWSAMRKRDAAHGRVGMILPEPGVDSGRQRAVQVPRMSPGGIILPVAA